MTGKNDSFRWHHCAAPHFDANLDIFLEQTQTEATAGLVFREKETATYHRFRLATDRYQIIALFEAVTSQAVNILSRDEIATIQCGFSLQVTKQENVWRCKVGHQTVFSVILSANVAQAGLFNGSGQVNLFDNFEIAQR